MDFMDDGQRQSRLCFAMRIAEESGAIALTYQQNIESI